MSNLPSRETAVLCHSCTESAALAPNDLKQRGTDAEDHRLPPVWGMLSLLPNDLQAYPDDVQKPIRQSHRYCYKEAKMQNAINVLIKII